MTKTRNALATLLGRPPGSLAELTVQTAGLPAVEPLVIQEIPTRSQMRRPDVRAAALQVAAQSAQIGIAEADFYPSIALLGSIGLSGNSLSASPDTGTLTLGPSFSWHIFDHGRIENNVRVQDALLQQSIEQYQETVLQAAREIDDAAISVVKTAEQQRVLEQSVVAARRSLELANSRYREGYADFQRVLDAQSSLFVQTGNELANQSNYVSAVVALYKALGGGWLDTPVQQLIPRRCVTPCSSEAIGVICSAARCRQLNPIQHQRLRLHQWIVYPLFPEDSAAAGAAKPTPSDADDSNWIALRVVLIVLPPFLMALANPSMYLKLIMKAVALGQQGSEVSARTAGKEPLGSTFLGGCFAILFWFALKIHPSLSMFFFCGCCCSVFIFRARYTD